MKYFLMGAFATGLLLYGIALIYGVTGATNLEGYRIDGRAVIKEFERWEKSGKKMEGTAARVLVPCCGTGRQSRPHAA